MFAEPPEIESDVNTGKFCRSFEPVSASHGSFDVTPDAIVSPFRSMPRARLENMEFWTIVLPMLGPGSDAFENTETPLTLFDIVLPALGPPICPLDVPPIRLPDENVVILTPLPPLFRADTPPAATPI